MSTFSAQVRTVKGVLADLELVIEFFSWPLHHLAFMLLKNYWFKELYLGLKVAASLDRTESFIKTIEGQVNWGQCSVECQLHKCVYSSLDGSASAPQPPPRRNQTQLQDGHWGQILTLNLV